MWSGITLTTLMNCIAVLLISSNVFYNVNNIKPSELTRQRLEKLIPECAEAVGYVVTVDYCECVEDIQFLKTSPGQDDSGNMCMFVNLGPVLRSLGTCKGDVPGGAKNFGNHFASTVLSCADLGSNCVLESLRKCAAKICPSPTLEIKLDGIIAQHSIGQTVSNSSLCRRYKCTEVELVEFCTLIENMKVGQMIIHPMMDKIMYKDYGFPLDKPMQLSPCGQVARGQLDEIHALAVGA